MWCRKSAMTPLRWRHCFFGKEPIAKQLVDVLLLQVHEEVVEANNMVSGSTGETLVKHMFCVLFSRFRALSGPFCNFEFVTLNQVLVSIMSDLANDGFSSCDGVSGICRATL